jgi:hypothetical protein
MSEHAKQQFDRFYRPPYSIAADEGMRCGKSTCGAGHRITSDGRHTTIAYVPIDGQLPEAHRMFLDFLVNAANSYAKAFPDDPAQAAADDRLNSLSAKNERLTRERDEAKRNAIRFAVQCANYNKSPVYRKEAKDFLARLDKGVGDGR